MRSAIIAGVIVGLVWAHPAAAQDEQPTWHAHVGDGVAALNYAIPDSDDGDFALVCDVHRKRVELVVYREIADMNVGRDIDIVLSAGGKMVTVKGKSATDEMMGFVYGRAGNVVLAPVLTVLQEGGELKVTMGKAKASYPEKGRKDAVARFSGSCKLR
jgi:hypothetical protein